MARLILAVILFNSLLCCPLSAQRQMPTQVPTIHATTREVVLDVVVRDKHHRPVSNLRPDEVQVFEDGVRQKIDEFRSVGGAEQLQTELENAKNAKSPSAKSDSLAPTTTLRQLNFVSIVLAQIAPLNLEFAREAVLDFLKSDTLPNTYVTIYRMDRGLNMVQSYTSNKELLTSAVNKVTKTLRSKGGLGLHATVAAGADAAVQATVDNILANPLTGPATAQAMQNLLLNPLPTIAIDPMWARNASSQDASVTLGNALLTEAKLASSLRFAESFSNGMDTMMDLRNLVRSQERLPGRKVVIYLADGLTLPMERQDVVNSLIGFANQAGVVFYAVDTRGLSVEDPVSHPLSTLEQAAAESAANTVNPRFGHMEDDDIGLAVTSNTQLAMEDLAESTGGFAVSNTNEIAQPMERMMEDIRTHYELAYTPTDTDYDGHFRKIEVHISRPHVKVQTRSGYFAVPDINGEPLQPFEMTALNAINQRPAPVAFPYDAALIKFRPGPDGVAYDVAFDIPISGLRVIMNHDTGKSQIRVSLLALIRKENGEIVGKISRNLVRPISKAELHHLQNQHIIYAEPMELPAGHYLIDTAVTDQQARKTSVKHISVFVDSGQDFGLSSVELVKTIWPMSGPPNPMDPFETSAVRVLPTLSPSVLSGRPVDIYFIVYPQNATGEGSTVTLQMFHDGKEIARKQVPLPQPQADGSVPMLMQLTPEPGHCDVVVTAQQGALAAQSSLSLQIVAARDENAN